ncbi:hypothetical protein ACSBR2_004834 [Camellia fascicularis]
MADSIPDGWHEENEIGKNGKEIKCYKNDIGQTFYSMEALMRYVNYAKRAEVSIYAQDPKFKFNQKWCYSGLLLRSWCLILLMRLNPPKVRKQAEKAAAGKQCSKDLMPASNQSNVLTLLC